MIFLIVSIFIIGYVAIIFEHNINVDKAASAILTGVLIWVVFAIGAENILGIDYSWNISELISNKGNYLKNFKEFISIDNNQSINLLTSHFIIHELEHHLVEIASISFFLIGAMTIVELIDTYQGFSVITEKITTNKRIYLIWIIAGITFFFSATLDNLTASIVMCALLRKLIRRRKELWIYAGIVIISANAGGAWSPIGDVTTIMLWVGGQITSMNIITSLFLPSLIAVLIPLIILSLKIKGNSEKPKIINTQIQNLSNFREKKIILYTGGSLLIFIPIFKTITHLPPFMGVFFGLGIMWVLTELLNKNKIPTIKSKLSIRYVLSKIEIPTILFFIGILLAISGLQSTGCLLELATFLNKNVGNIYLINIIIGLFSSIVDNVPLVAGAMGMYELGPLKEGLSYPVDHSFWEFLAYCAGTGGSCLLIGSAAGVAVMGITKMNFIWYLKKMSLLGLIGYLSGALVYILIQII